MGETGRDPILEVSNVFLRTSLQEELYPYLLLNVIVLVEFFRSAAYMNELIVNFTKNVGDTLFFLVLFHWIR